MKIVSQRLQVTALCALTFGTSQAFAIEPGEAALTDWVVDTSGTYLCNGYYSPPAMTGNPDDDELTARAQNTDYDGADRVILSGDAFITRGDFELEADRISFLNSTGDGDAEGGVKIRRPGSLLMGDSASVNVRTNAFDLRNSSFVTHENGLRGDSELAIGSPNGDIEIVNGVVTFCAPESNAWDLKANRISLNESAGRGWANDVIVRVKGVPVFYTPALGFPLDDRRLTGLLFPSYSVGSESGTEIVSPFYWNLAPNYDALIQPRWMTARGQAVGLHGRYLFEDFSLLDVKTEQLPDDKLTQTDRQVSRLTLDSDPAKQLTWNLTYENASDHLYQDDVSNFANLSDDQQLVSSARALMRGDDWTVGWLIDQVDVVDPRVTGSSVKFSRQPQLTATWSHYGAHWNLFASGDLTEFTRDTKDLAATDASEGRRFSSDLKAEYPLSASYGTLTPSVLAFPRWSEATTADGVQDTQYVTFGSALDGSLIFEKYGADGSLHELIPRARLLMREPNTDPTVIKFDTPETENDLESVGQLFLDNPISGGDFVGDTREVALSLTSRGIDNTGTETYRVTAGRTLYLADRDVTVSGTPETTDQGPLVLESQVRLAESLRWNTRFNSVADNETMASATNELKYRTSETDYITQRLVWDHDQAVRADLYYSNQMGAFRVLAGLQWEPDTEKRVNQVLGLEYESCCWRAAVVHAYERDQVTEANGGTSVKLQLELKGLGALGRGASTLMDRLLEDYELSESRF